MTIEELRDQLATLNESANAIQSLADEEKRELTENEQSDLVRLLNDFDKAKEDLEQRERLEEQNKRMVQTSRSFTPDPPGAVPGTEGDDPEPGGPEPRSRNRVPATAAEPRGRWGWSSFGEQALAIRRASRTGGHVDKRLEVRAPTTFGSEAVGADGGFAVAPDFRDEIMQKLNAEESLLALTDPLVTAKNQITVPKDETTPWQTTGGIQCRWEGEGTQLAQSKPALETATIRLNKMSALVPITEELLDDAPGLDGWLRRKVPEKMSAKIDLAILSGTGVGQPLGIIGAPGTKSVAKETSQTPDTVNALNILKMYNAMWAQFRGDAVWIANQDIEPQLQQMILTPGSLTDFALYIPAGGFSQAPFGTLFGKRVIYHQAAETLGDLGDILFVNLKKYVNVQKTGGIRADTSMHLWFDYDQTAFRFIFRIGGQPWFSSTIAARDGSATYSPHVTLAERA